MEKYTNEKTGTYPFNFYCNSLGELFNPANPGDGNEGPKSLPNMTFLPYRLMEVYVNYWGEGLAGAQTYIAEVDGTAGLVLIYEISLDPDEESDAGFAVRMEDLMKNKVLPDAELVEKALKGICPEAVVYVGDCSGFDECHELSVFLPWNIDTMTMWQALYILNLYSVGADRGFEIPTCLADIRAGALANFTKAHPQNGGNPGEPRIRMEYQPLPTETIKFQEQGCGVDGATITVEIALNYRQDVKTLGAQIDGNIRRIKLNAAKCGAFLSLDPDTLIRRAMDADLYGRWEYIRTPTLTITF